MHIPKTAGRFFGENLMTFLNYELRQRGIKSEDLISSDHAGWRDDPDYFIISTIRNPVRRYVSHLVFYNQELISQDLHLSKDYLFYAAHQEENQFLINYQAKYISFSGENLGEKINNNDMNNDMSRAIERFNRINLKFNADNISNKTVVEAYNICCDVLNILDAKRLTLPNLWIGEFTSSYSLELYNSLSSSEMSTLEEMHSVDMELYESVKSEIIQSS